MGNAEVWGAGGAYSFGGENDGMRLLGRPKLRGEDNIKMDLQEVG